jgi:hypothetical protein
MKRRKTVSRNSYSREAAAAIFQVVGLGGGNSRGRTRGGSEVCDGVTERLRLPAPGPSLWAACHHRTYRVRLSSFLRESAGDLLCMCHCFGTMDACARHCSHSKAPPLFSCSFPDKSQCQTPDRPLHALFLPLNSQLQQPISTP